MVLNSLVKLRDGGGFDHGSKRIAFSLTWTMGKKTKFSWSGSFRDPILRSVIRNTQAPDVQHQNLAEYDRKLMRHERGRFSDATGSIPDQHSRTSQSGQALAMRCQTG